MKILITGASGYLGSGLQYHLKPIYKDVVGTYHSHLYNNLIFLDVTNSLAVNSTISAIHPDLIIHCAALVDGCEKNPILAEQLNVKGTENIENVAREKEISVIYISTAAVFDGKKGIFSEKDIPKSQSVYGKTKLEGENIIAKRAGNLIIRPTLLFGYAPHGMQERFFGKVIHALSLGEPIRLDDVWQFTPSSINHVSKVIRWWIEKGRNMRVATLHVCCPEITTKFQLAQEIGKQLNLSNEYIRRKKSAEERYASLLAPQIIQEFGGPFLSLKEALQQINLIREGIYHSKEKE